MKIYFCFLVLLLLTGCVEPGGSRLIDQVAIPLRCVDKQIAVSRQKEFSELLSPMKIKGVSITPRAWCKDYSAEQVAKKISSFGFNRVFAKIDGVECFQGEAGEKLSELANALAAVKIPVELVFYPRDYAWRPRGNRLVRNFIHDYPTLKEAIISACRWNEYLQGSSKIKGVTVAVEPHIFSLSNETMLHRQKLVWSERTFGIGLDNDLMMKASLSAVKELKNLPDLPSLSIATTDFFHQLVKDGKLSCGSINDCAAIGDKVVIFNRGNKPSELVNFVVDELSSAPENKVLIWIEIAQHTSVNKGGLRRRNWNDLIHSMRYAITRYQNYPACAGIVAGPLTILEFMHQEQD